jgi:uncharacterized cupin superfamily protein
MTRATNIWNIEWEASDEDEGLRGQRLLERPKGTRLVAAVWELDPGKESGPYHIHHATEELLLVLRGRPTLRTPDGERQLEEGDVAHFPAGPDGAHQVINRSDGVVRYVMAASHSPLDVIEYLDESKVLVWTAAESPQMGKPLFIVHELTDDEADALDYDADAVETRD